MHHYHSRQLRPKTMLSYEQTLKLFGVWLADTTAVTRVEDIREKHIRAYIVELQERGKYMQVADRKAQKYNCPQNRRDYCAKLRINWPWSRGRRKLVIARGLGRMGE